MSRAPLSPITEARRSYTCGPEHPNGLRFQFYLDGDREETEWTATEALEGWVGLVHGPAFAALHDDAAAFAMMALTGRTGLTTRMDIRFFRPIRIGQQVTARGRVRRFEARQGEFESRPNLFDAT